MKSSLLSSVAVATLAVSSFASADFLAFDAMTGVPSSSWSIPSGGGSAASTGNRFMGAAVNVAAGTTAITGFDTTMINNSGAAITFGAGWKVSLNYWIYNTWTPSATTAPAFADLAGSGSVEFDMSTAGTVNNNSFYFFTQNASPGAGITPPAASNGGVVINPVSINPTSGSTIGVVLNWKIDRNDGNGFVLLGGLSSVVTGGATAIAPSVGSNAFTSATGGYYRSAGGETNGNFLGNSARNIGNNSSVMFRMYAVPGPGAAALLGVAGLVAVRRRR